MESYHLIKIKEEQSFSNFDIRKMMFLQLINKDNQLEHRQDKLEAELSNLKKQYFQNSIESVQPSISSKSKIENEIQIIKKLTLRFIEEFDDLFMRLANIVTLQNKLYEIEKLFRKNIHLEYQLRSIVVFHEVVCYNPSEDISFDQANLISDCIICFCDNLFDITKDQYINFVKKIRSSGMLILPTSTNVLEKNKKTID